MTEEITLLPVREFLDRGTKWLLETPENTNCLLRIMGQIWDRQRRVWLDEKIPETQWRFCPILPVLFYTGKASWKPPLTITALMDLPEPLERFVPQHDTLFFNLKTTDPEELVAEGHPFGWVLHVIQKEDVDKEEFSEALKEVVFNLDRLPEEERNPWVE